MRERLATVSVFLLVMAMVALGVLGCSRAAEVRGPEATEPVVASETDVPSGGEEATAGPGETVVSAVTSEPGTSGAEEQPTQAPAAETPAAMEPTATVTSSAATAEPPSQPPPPSGQAGVVWHTVQRGETLSSIARRYGTTWQAIARANGVVNPNQIHAGQKLQISASTGSTGSTATGCRIRHTVKSGEWVWQIARNYKVSPYDILAASGLTIQTGKILYPGKVLCIP
jgi:LysM repeat protein